MGLGREAGSVSEGACGMSRGDDPQRAGFMDLVVSRGVCAEDVDLGTTVFGSLEHDSRRIRRVRKRTKMEPGRVGSEPGREGHCVHGWQCTETLVTPERPQWMR